MEVEYSRPLLPCESLEYDLGVGINAEVLCCTSVGRGCGGVLPSGSSVQCSTSAASKYLHCWYNGESQSTVKKERNGKTGRPISLSGKLVKKPWGSGLMIPS